tara:strand:- start:439 stop:597 length:159 start_codon:yes stop_codon:yes gene_type:complete
MMRDRTEAMALQLAEKQLSKGGWKFNPTTIGLVAAQIIKGLDTGLAEKGGKA